MRFKCVILSAILFAFAAHADDITVEETVTAAISQGDPVHVDNINGDIHVESGDSQEIVVTYTITCETREEMDAIDVEYSTENGVRFSVDYDDAWEGNNNGKVDFLVLVPSGTGLDYELDNVNGEIMLSDLSGSAVIDLVNGDVKVVDFAGQVSVDVVNGEIELQGISGLKNLDIVNGSAVLTVGELLEDLSIESVNASISMILQGDADVSVETLSGSMDIDGSFSAEIERDVVGCSAEFGTGDRKITVSTINGDIEITR